METLGAAAAGLLPVRIEFALPAPTIAATPKGPLKATLPSLTVRLTVSNSKLVPRTEAVALGPCTVQLALVPAGGFTSTLTLPVCIFTLRFSVPAELCISARVRRVRGRTVITVLPTAITAVPLKPVDTIVFRETLSPARAATKAAAPAGFNSTSQVNSRITPVVEFCAKMPHTTKLNIKTTQKVFFI
jgi:hypothetical protein